MNKERTEAHGLLSAEVPCALTQGIFPKTPQGTHLNPFALHLEVCILKSRQKKKEQRFTSLLAEGLSHSLNDELYHSFFFLFCFFLYIISSTNRYVVASAVHCSHGGQAEGRGVSG